MKEITGEKHKNWKGGKPKCIDCGIKIFYTSKRCRKCAANTTIRLEKNREPRPHLRGENHPNWIKDRTKLKKGDRHSKSSAYKEWKLTVKKRDGWKCRIDNEDCRGQLDAHHILPWKDYPELRYKINNGITLCQAHHPKKRAEEKRLIPFFTGLVSVSNEII